MKRWLQTVALTILVVLPAYSISIAVETLRVYFIDVEGGQSTLFITPADQSLLIDTGWPDNNYRDADRIVKVAHQAGLNHIDYVLLTHYHDDHVGGVPQLVARIPVGTFIDHGPNRELENAATMDVYAAYQAVLASKKYEHITAVPGETLPVLGITATVISADGKVIDKAQPGAGDQNSYCRESEIRPDDKTENARSLGTLIIFGKLSILDLGDLTWDKEMRLMCPIKRLGHVDVLIVSHHGWYQSSSPALVHAIRPCVAIMDNSETKGGSTATFKTLATSPGIQSLWQLHFSDEAGPKLNSPGKYIANPNGPDAANYIELTGHKDGSFEVINSRNNYSQKYTACTY